MLIGGLGLGFTLRAALRHLREDAEVVVAELLAEVIAWNADPRYGLSVDAMRDPRVRVQTMTWSTCSGRTPLPSMRSCSTRTTAPMGCSCPRTRHCTPRAASGSRWPRCAPADSIVYWSVADDPGFAGTLRGPGLAVRTLHARAHDTAGPMHTLYVATPRA